MKASFVLTLLLGLSILVGYSGCFSLGQGDAQPTLYYTLKPVDAPPIKIEGPGPPLVVGLDRIEVPSYLDRREIAVRTGDNELRYTSRNLWAERPSDTLQRLLSMNIERQVSLPAKVHSLPWPDHSNPSWVVHLNIESFEGQEAPRTELLLDVSWSILTVPGGRMAKQGQYRASNLDWTKGDYASLAQALSQGLADLGRLIAQDLDALEVEPSR